MNFLAFSSDLSFFRDSPGRMRPNQTEDSDEAPNEAYSRTVTVVGSPRDA